VLFARVPYPRDASKSIGHSKECSDCEHSDTNRNVLTISPPKWGEPNAKPAQRHEVAQIQAGNS